jgi:polyisoprenyl-phosphate glycosyltransferase
MFIPLISVLIPVYKATDSLVELIERLTNSLNRITSEYEIILVEDGCPDGSWEKVLEVHKDYPFIKALRLSRNFGQHSALTAALDFANGEWIVIMDCDLQDQPEEIEKLYSKASIENYDSVFGARANRQDSVFKRLCSRSFYAVLSYLTGSEIDSRTSNFGIYSRRLMNEVKQMREQLRWYPAMIRWAGFRTTTIEIDHAARVTGSSSYNFRKLLHLSIDVICISSDKPLRLSIKGGLLMSLTSMLIGIFISLRTIIGSATPPLGWSSLFVSIWFVGGLLIFNLGVIGLYVSRIFNEVRAKPIYIVTESLGFDKEIK